MEYSKQSAVGSIALALTGILALGLAVTEVLAGPLKPALANIRTWIMMGETSILFLWLWFCLCREDKKWLRMAGAVGGILLGTWLHRIFLPFVVSGMYAALLALTGRQILRLFLPDCRLPLVQRASVSMTLGSSFWIILVCMVSLTGRGGMDLWRFLAALMALAAVLTELAVKWKGRRRKDKIAGGQNLLAELRCLRLWPQGRIEACLWAFILSMAFIQLGRMNIELDYDSLHYGLRSAFVLDNGKGIYENLGMMNLVYTYSKGLEVLVFPLVSGSTYGYVLAFSFWCTMGSLILAAQIVGRRCTRRAGLWTAALVAAVPAVMNMAATAKSDGITLFVQLMIYDFLSMAFLEKKRTGMPQKEGRRIPWLLMAVSAYILTLVYKPTAMVFSTALGAVALLCLVLTKRFTLGDRRGWLLLLPPGAAVAGLWYRTWLLTGVPMTSIFAGFFEKIGFTIHYPFRFTHVIGDPSIWTFWEKMERLCARLWGILFVPVGRDMDHVIIAWGTGLVTLFLLLWLFAAFQRTFLKRSQEAEKGLDVFDLVLIPVLALGSVVSVYTLSQVDGNYFILFYTLLIISSQRMAWGLPWGKWMEQVKYSLFTAFFVVNALVTCVTGWAGAVGFTPVSLRHKGYYDHQRAREERRMEEGNLALSHLFSPRDRVLALGDHPKVLDLPCCVQSYYDVTGSGGNVYLVKKLAYFEEFLQYAGVQYFFVEAGYLSGQDRARQIVEDMIAEGSLSELRYECGHMAARLTLGAPPPEDPEKAVEEFYANYRLE